MISAWDNPEFDSPGVTAQEDFAFLVDGAQLDQFTDLLLGRQTVELRQRLAAPFDHFILAHLSPLPPAHQVDAGSDAGPIPDGDLNVGLGLDHPTLVDGSPSSNGQRTVW
jgi:hypothetical protein